MTDEADLRPERILKAAIEVLGAGDDTAACALLLNCDLSISYEDSWYSGNRYREALRVVLQGPSGVYRVLARMRLLSFNFRNGEEGYDPDPIVRAIHEALEAAVDAVIPDSSIIEYGIRLQSEPPYPGWREEYLAELRGDTAPRNQAVIGSTQPAFAWNGLRFRSRTEQVLAKALHKRGLLFFPLPAAVAGEQKFEPDFLICDKQGRWGILEVHGDQFHPAETAAKEHERSRWFKARGVKVVEIFDARRCFNEPDSVIDDFLNVLAST